MRGVFLAILRMGLVSGYAVLVVLLVRWLLRRFPKRYSYLLWGAVLLRLVCPVGIESSFSLVPDALYAQADVAEEENTAGAGACRAAMMSIWRIGKDFAGGQAAGKILADGNGAGDGMVEGSGNPGIVSAGKGTDGSGEFESAAQNNAEGGGNHPQDRQADSMGDAGEAPQDRQAGGMGEEGKAPQDRQAGSMPDAGEILQDRQAGGAGRTDNVSAGGQYDSSGSTTVPENGKYSQNPLSAYGKLSALSSHTWLIPFLGGVWVAGMLVFWLVWAFTVRRFRKRLLGAVRVEEGVYETPQVAASFVDGVFHPVIYLATGLTGMVREYVLCHERVHIRRHDPFIKALALFLLSIYWFHPLIWLAFKKMCEDMEMSCDERVVECMGTQIKKEYSGALLQMSQGADGISLFAAFGGNEVKSRVKNVLSYRKPKTWLGILLSVVVAAVGIGLLLNPGRKDVAAAGENVEGQSGPGEDGNGKDETGADGKGLSETGNGNDTGNGNGFPEKGNSGHLDVPDKIKEKSGIKQYGYPAEFSMGDNLKMAITQLALSYGSFDQDIVGSGGWKEIFVARLIQNSRASFDYLDMLSQKTDGQVDAEELYYIHYSLTGMELDFSSYEGGSVNRYDAASAFNYGSVSGYGYEDAGDGLIVTADFEIGFDGSSFVQRRRLTVNLVRNPYSCFDGYSIVSIASEVVGPEEEYASFLTAYYTALKEEWGKQKLNDGGFSILAAYCYGEDTLENIGYAFLDLDGDGTEELLVGAIGGDDFIRQQIFELYYLKDGVPTRVLEAWERNRYYLCREDGSYRVVNESSSSASDGGWSCNVVREGKLVPTKTIVYDGSGSGAEEDAQAVIRAYEEYRIVPEYVPFSKFGAIKTGAGEDGGMVEFVSSGKWKLAGKELEKQLNLILSQRPMWDLADTGSDGLQYAVTDLDRNGRLELLSAYRDGGNVHFYLYEVSKDGNTLLPCTRTLSGEDNFQPNITSAFPTMYLNQATGETCFICTDMMRDDTGYCESQWVLSFKNGHLTEQVLVSRKAEHNGFTKTITYDPGELGEVAVASRAEYGAAADMFFPDWVKGKICISKIYAEGAFSTEEWYQKLEESYHVFSFSLPKMLSVSEKEAGNRQAEKEFLERWKQKTVGNGFGDEAEAMAWYGLFVQNGLLVEAGEKLEDVCIGDFDKDGNKDCFFVTGKSTDLTGFPYETVDGIFYGCMNGKSFYKEKVSEELLIALSVVAGDFNHNGFTELILSGDTGSCGGARRRVQRMLQFRGGKFLEWMLPEDKNGTFAYDKGIDVAVYETEERKKCRAVLEWDGRETHFTITGSREYAPFLDEQIPGWRDGKEPFGGSGGGYTDFETIERAGKDYLLAKEYLVPVAGYGQIGFACLLFDWDPYGNVLVKDFYVEPF